MSAATPGPWEADAIEVVGVDQEGGWLPIAKVYDYDEASQAANACLIAAAPELLEALEDCLRQLEATPYLWTDGYERIEALVARAKGRAQCLT